MKHIKTYEAIDFSFMGKDFTKNNSFYKDYIIVENFPNFLNSNVSIILFKITNIVGFIVEMKQLRYYYKGNLEIGSSLHTTNINDLSPHIIYQTDDFKDAENMLDVLENSKKYNL